MAVWQFVIDFVPEQFLLDSYGQIPEVISLADRKEADYFRNTRCLVKEVMPYLQSFGTFDENSWSGTHLYHGEGDHDVVVYFNEETNQVKEISCRVDMRQPDEGFLFNVVTLATTFNWHLMARGSRQLFAPTVRELRLAMMQSNARRFVTDPLKFLTDLSNGDTPAASE